MSQAEKTTEACNLFSDIIHRLSGLKDFLADEKFIFPFSATLGATLTVLLLQFINRYVSERKKKIYSVSYIADVCARLLEMNCILKKNTISPHIEAAEKIISGDKALLETTFLADEFDILTDNHIKFNVLPEEYKVLLGCDDISLIQSYEALGYLASNDVNRKNLNIFVKENLKSQHTFMAYSPEKQADILNSYWDYVDKIKHETDRTLWLIIHVIIPKLASYIKGKQFTLFSKKSIEQLNTKINELSTEYDEILPEFEYMEKVRNGGIQNAL